jgi:hypothetical protein
MQPQRCSLYQMVVPPHFGALNIFEVAPRHALFDYLIS